MNGTASQINPFAPMAPNVFSGAQMPPNPESHGKTTKVRSESGHKMNDILSENSPKVKLRFLRCFEPYH